MKYITLLSFFIINIVSAQNGKVSISGQITSAGAPIPYASIYVKSGTQGTDTDKNGYYKLDLNAEKLTLVVQAQGYRTQEKLVNLTEGNSQIINFNITEDVLGLDQVVVSATRNRITKKEAPVIVKVLSPKLFNATQSASLADGLNYQPGVRVETNCQNCGFTQVRMNGLEGQYTQILVNSRPVFSALNGVYGLEQIPVSVIDRVEVVRSGGSALFGSNAIAGTINVITKEPVTDGWVINSTLALIDGKTADRNVNINGSVVSEDLASGVTVYGIFRDRDAYDANGDGFSEITQLTNNSLGMKSFLRPNDNSRIGLDFTAIRENRRGGNKLNLSPQFTDVTEALDHNTIFSGLDYEHFNDKRTQTISLYTSIQHTNRDSYYGGLGGGRTAEDSTVANNAFGNTKDLAFVTGAKFNHTFNNSDIITTGLEYQLNDTDDAIMGYNRLVDQTVNSIGLYGQYEWKPTAKFSVLIGARLDHVTVDGYYTIETVESTSNVSETVLSPRLTLLYNLTDKLQLRGGYARGFRAPQAFNEDLHISSVGGEQRFVILSHNLKSEFSNAYTASLDYYKDFNNTQTNLLLEGFYTTLENPFTIVSTGAVLTNGSILEETRNGAGAYVAGANIELSISPSPDLFFQAGVTVQKSIYKDDQILFEADESLPKEHDVALNKFVRTPNTYGFITSNWQISESLKLDITGNYTGTMVVPLVVSDSGFVTLNETESFFDITTKLTYHFDPVPNFHVELSGGVQNLLDRYQSDFDSGADRDSTYIYGPNRPRTIFIGLKFGDF